MSLRMEFVERAEKGEKIAPLCREFAISRTTGHKWLKRFKERGFDGLEEKSRRPKTTPLATGEDIIVAVLEARDAKPRLGPKKLAEILRRRWGEQTPAPRTIARILKRANRVRARRRAPVLHLVHRAPEVHAAKPNDVWTVDFKGWWRTLDGERCEPLTVRDAHSRFVLAVDVIRPTTEEVKRVFERLFRKYGVPLVIQCDNGTPFVCVRAKGGISTLSAWWLSLGIRLARSRPGCPQDNGGHERMHADIAADVEAAPAATVASERRRLARWRQDFNHVRPHDALAGKVPADLYRVDEPRRLGLVPYRYSPNCLVRRVEKGGTVSVRGELLFVSQALRGHLVGLELAEPLKARVWFRDLDLGLVETTAHLHSDHFEVAPPRRKRASRETSTSAKVINVPPSAGAAAALLESPCESSCVA